MPPSAPDEDLLADFLLQWEESDRRMPVGEAAERLASMHPHLIDELKRRMVYLNQMSWLDDPASNSMQHGDALQRTQRLLTESQQLRHAVELQPDISHISTSVCLSSYDELSVCRSVRFKESS